jgi:hypothetical protein
MTTLASSTEAILEKLMRLAYGDLELVQRALAETARDAGGVPRLEDVVQYIVGHRKPPEGTSISGNPL